MERCPTCGRIVHVYHRTITAAMAAVLIVIHRRANGDWMYLPPLKVQFSEPRLKQALSGGDVSKLRFWGLLEMRDGNREDGSKRIGWYRITRSGDDFCRGFLRVPKYADVLHNELQKLHGPLIDVRDALRKWFDYEELINL